MTVLCERAADLGCRVAIIVGVNYTLAAETLGDLVQAAVATTLINELDDVAVFLYGRMAKSVEVTCVRCEKPACASTSVALHFFLTIPVLVSVSLGITHGLRN